MDTKTVLEHFAPGEARPAQVRAVADALGIARQAVDQWGDTVPILRAYQIEVVTGGALRAPAKTEARV